MHSILENVTVPRDFFPLLTATKLKVGNIRDHDNGMKRGNTRTARQHAIHMHINYIAQLIFITRSTLERWLDGVLICLG